MQSIAIITGQDSAPEAQAAPAALAKKSFRTPAQPLEAINVPGALLKLKTLTAISGLSISTLYRAAGSGQLTLVKKGARCTRVTSESARAYLELLAKEAA